MSTTNTPRLGSETLLEKGSLHPATLTSEASSMSSPTISKATPNAISSPASADGRSPCGWPDGPTIDMFGPVPVPAKISHSPGSRQALEAIEIYGLSGGASSASAALTASLVNRLTTLLRGSTELPLIWKASATPAGRPLFQLLPSERSTKDCGFTLVPTPTRRDGRTLAGSQPPKRSPTSGLPLAWFIAKRLGVFKGRLSPIVIGSLMGYPAKVSRLAPMATRSSRKSPRPSSARRSPNSGVE